jgi:hypothetical protein
VRTSEEHARRLDCQRLEVAEHNRNRNPVKNSAKRTRLRESELNLYVRRIVNLMLHEFG